MKNLLLRLLLKEQARPYRVRTCRDSGLTMVELGAAGQPLHK